MTVLLFVEGFSSFCGFVGGIPLVLDPTGKLLGLPLRMLSSLPIPVHDFLLPGLWLLFVYGVGFTFLTYLLWSGRRYAWPLALVLCVVWLGWITFEMIFFGPSPLIWIWYAPQIAALILLLRPDIRRFAVLDVF
jgi:hypothetical protein